MKIRSSVQALVIKNQKILAIKKVAYNNKTMYLLPGGGQNPGETLKEAAVRECKEETGVEVEVQELLFVSEYIGQNHEHAEWDSDVHVVVHLFACNVIDEGNFGRGTEIDHEQISLEWLPLKELPSFKFYPKAIIPHLINYGSHNKIEQVYVGDMG